MRLANEFRNAIAREGPLARAAIAAFFVAAVIYGGGKGDGGNGGGGDGDRGNGSLTPMGDATMPFGYGMPRDYSPNGVSAVSSLCFAAMSVVSNDMVALTVAWPEDLLPCPATLDFFVKTNLTDRAWDWLFAETALPGTSNLAASVSLSAIADGTNAPPSAFFHFRHREADCQTMRDFDGDGIPDVYELHNGTNPYVRDAALAPRLTVGADGAYTGIPDALAASTGYSIISLAPETFTMHQPLELPAHPVMLVGEDGHATISSDATIGAFVIDKGNDCRTLVKGVDIVLAARSGFQSAFWCGGNSPWNGLAAAPSFEDVRIRAPYPEPLYYGWHFYRTTTNAVSIRNCTVNAAGASSMHGIYSYDGPPLEIGSCSFVNFPQDHAGVFVQATSGYHCGSSNAPAVSVSGCAFDGSFTNAVPLARLGSATNAANCFVAMRDCIVPAALDPEYAPDFAGDVCVTNGGLSWNGLALPGSAAYAFGIGDIRGTDFTSASDADADGLSDHDEAFLHETDPWLADSDGDELTDGAEIDYGTDPKDFHSCFRRITAMSRKPSYALSITNYIAWGAGTNAWTTNVLTAIAEAASTNVFDFATTGETLFFAEFCDIDRDGAYDGETDFAIFRTAPPLANVQTLVFDFSSVVDVDGDRDGMPDLWERIHAGAGLSPTNAADAMFDFDGDGLPNLQEYLMGYDPELPDGSNTVFAVASRSIDERIAGKNPTNALPAFLNYPACGTNLVHNTDCWAYGIDLSCASPWHSRTPRTVENKNTVTLISSRHFVTASHYHPSLYNNTILYFVGTDGGVYSNRFDGYVDVGNDIRIGKLAWDMTNVCTIAKILPPNYTNYLPTLKGLPIFTFDQEEKALVCELGYVENANINMEMCSTLNRQSFHEKAIDGDSSSPWFMLLDAQPILLTTYHSSTAGPWFDLFRSEMQNAMDALFPGYQLQEADLSGFDQITSQEGGQ